MTFEEYQKANKAAQIAYADEVRETMKETHRMLPNMHYKDLAEYCATAYNAYVGPNYDVPATFVLWAKYACDKGRR